MNFCDLPSVPTIPWPRPKPKFHERPPYRDFPSAPTIAGGPFGEPMNYRDLPSVPTINSWAQALWASSLPSPVPTTAGTFGEPINYRPPLEV